jgi:hypothetical protein
MKLTYDEVVSICDAHGICLPVDCVEMVVSIVEHIHPDHSGDGGEKHAAYYRWLRDRDSIPLEWLRAENADEADLVIENLMCQEKS